MRFAARADMDLPIDTAFDRLSDFAAFERIAAKRGVEVERTGKAGSADAWHLKFRLRGKMRAMALTLDRCERPEALAFLGESKSFNLHGVITLIALSRTRTRLGTEIDVRPRTLSGRLFLQSMRLVKSGYSRKFEAGVQSLAERITQGPLSR